jgi:nucleotide-binding universal stress UspA family protein
VDAGPPGDLCKGGAAVNEELALQRIVVGVDGSTGSLAALRWAEREAGLRDAALHVLRAWEDTTKRVAPYASHAHPPGGQEDHQSAAAGLKADVAAVLGPAPEVTVDARVAEGLAARVLLDHAVGADLLVLGSATRCAPDGIGPVARACLRHAPCPVVVVSVEMTGVPVPVLPDRIPVPA